MSYISIRYEIDKHKENTATGKKAVFIDITLASIDNI